MCEPCRLSDTLLARILNLSTHASKSSFTPTTGGTRSTGSEQQEEEEDRKQHLVEEEYQTEAAEISEKYFTHSWESPH